MKVNLPDTPKTEYYLKLALLVLSFLAIIYVFGSLVLPVLARLFANLWPLLLPLLLAVTLAIAIDPIVSILERRLKLRRQFAVFWAMVTIVLILIAVISLLVFRLTVEIMHLVDNMPEIIASVEQVWDKISDMLLPLVGGLGSLDSVRSWIIQAMQTFSEYSYVVLDNFSGAVMSVPLVLLMLLIIIIGGYYIAREKRNMGQKVSKFFPEGMRKKVVTVWNSSIEGFSGYFRSEMTLVLMGMVIATLGFLILNVQYAFTMGILVGFLDFIPAVGPVIVFLPWAIWQILAGNYFLGIGLLVVYAVMALSRSLLQPKLLSDNIGLHPLLTIVALFVGLQIGGVGGMILLPIFLVGVKGAIKALREEKTE